MNHEIDDTSQRVTSSSRGPHKISLHVHLSVSFSPSIFCACVVRLCSSLCSRIARSPFAKCGENFICGQRRVGPGRDPATHLYSSLPLWLASRVGGITSPSRSLSVPHRVVRGISLSPSLSLSDSICFVLSRPCSFSLLSPKIKFHFCTARPYPALVSMCSAANYHSSKLPQTTAVIPPPMTRSTLSLLTPRASHTLCISTLFLLLRYYCCMLRS